MEFVTRILRNSPDTLEVRYNCDCGCKPRARYRQGTDEAGNEHCCCGRVHFVGAQADKHLDAYIKERLSSGEDTRNYAITTYQVEAPWGPVAVAFGEPDVLTPH